jgi:hypothetical protein
LKNGPTLGNLKASSSSHILCCSQQPKKRKKLVTFFFGVTGILLGWEEFFISGVDDSQRMREKNWSFVNYRGVDDTPMGMIERLEFFNPKTSLLLCCVINPTTEKCFVICFSYDIAWFAVNGLLLMSSSQVFAWLWS